MEKKEIEAMFAKAVAQRLEKSNALGTKATWSMGDHLDVATRVVMKAAGMEFADAGDEEKEFAALREVVQATYNHSAFAQRLEKAFEKTGHFQRGRKGPQTADDALAMLAAAAQATEGGK